MINQHLPGILAWKFGLVAERDFSCMLQKDGKVEIIEWNAPAPQPTTEALMAFEAEYLAFRAADAPELALDQLAFPGRLLAAVVEVVGAQLAGEAPAAWAVQLIQAARSKITNARM